MKKVLSVVLIVLLSINLFGCSKTNTSKLIGKYTYHEDDVLLAFEFMKNGILLVSGYDLDQDKYGIAGVTLFKVEDSNLIRLADVDDLSNYTESFTDEIFSSCDTKEEVQEVRNMLRSLSWDDFDIEKIEEEAGFTGYFYTLEDGKLVLDIDGENITLKK